MNLLRRGIFATLLSISSVSQLSAQREISNKPSSAYEAIRREFAYQPELRPAEAAAPFAAVKSDRAQEEIIRLPNYVVREQPDQTKRYVDEAMAQHKRLGSGAVFKKSLGKRIRFEGLLPLTLDYNTHGHEVFRLDVLRFAW